LYNDLNAKRDQIHRALETVHSLAVGNNAGTMKQEDLVPFAIVNGVAPDSPANKAGILRGDKILKFGKVDKHTKDALESIGKELSLNENVVEF
jgi:26S proteasome regulatory subunit N4